MTVPEAGPSALDALARMAGILPIYHDLEGNPHPTSQDSRDALLAAMGLPVTEAGAAETVALWEAQTAARSLPRTLILAPHEARQLALARPSTWRLTTEAGEACADGWGEEQVDLPDLPLGLYNLDVDGQPTLVIVAPKTLPKPAYRTWGLTTALSGLWTRPEQGIGTYGDLALAGEAAADLGADFIGINPVHALGWAAGDYSPYSPTHRGYYDTRYLSVGSVDVSAQV
ncbi:MAG: hypothetical protein ACPGNT_11585, partial [Rhodospirillales bacterium]